jgi:hypothetical protein
MTRERASLLELDFSVAIGPHSKTASANVEIVEYAAD